jgi:hypothetical protein
MGQWVQFDAFLKRAEQTYEYLPVATEEPGDEPDEKKQKPPWHMRARSDGTCPRKHTHPKGRPSRKCVCLCPWCRGETT